MKRTLTLGAALLATVVYLPAATVSQWNFNGLTTNPSQGNGTARYVGGATNAASGQFAAGDSHSDPAGSTDNSAWNTSKYPALTTSNKTAGVRFDCDTTGYENIVVSWAQRNSATASRYWRVQYTVDGANFTDADTVGIYVDSVFTNKAADLSAIAGATNNPAFGFRIVAEWESTATGSGTNAYVATSTTNNYNPTGGTVRFDMVTISGTVIPGANTAPTISTLSNQTLRVNQSTGPLDFTVVDAEDPPGSLTLAQASSDVSVVPLANIAFGGGGADRTVNVSATGQTGASTLTLWVIDTGGRSNSTAFTVTVLPANTAPWISSLSRTNTLVNTPAPALSFTVGDLETPNTLTLTGASANPTLVPNANLVFGNNGANRTVTVTPAPGQTGVAPITLTVSDGTNTAATSFAVMVSPSPSVLFYEPFDYADGSLLTNSAFYWANRSGTDGECQVAGGHLQLSAVRTEDVVGPLIGGPYNASNQTVLYASFQVIFLTVPKGSPGLFAHFANGSTLRGRIYAGTAFSLPGFFRLFVANGSDSPIELPADLTTNVAYTVVTRYDLDTATTTLWVNPASESDAGATAGDPQTVSRIAAYGFRQDSDVGATMLVDNLRVGLSFADVAPDANPPGGRLTIQRHGGNVVLNWTNAAAALQAAPVPTGAFTNVPGATSPHTNASAGPGKFFRLKSN